MGITLTGSSTTYGMNFDAMDLGPCKIFFYCSMELQQVDNRMHICGIFRWMHAFKLLIHISTADISTIFAAIHHMYMYRIY